MYTFWSTINVKTILCSKKKNKSLFLYQSFYLPELSEALTLDHCGSTGKPSTFLFYDISGTTRVLLQYNTVQRQKCIWTTGYHCFCPGVFTLQAPVTCCGEVETLRIFVCLWCRTPPTNTEPTGLNDITQTFDALNLHSSLRWSHKVFWNKVFLF